MDKDWVPHDQGSSLYIRPFIIATDPMLGVRPGDALFCGDTILDAGAAQNAGTRFAAVLQGTTPAEAFERFHPNHISPDLWDLAEWLEL